MPLRLGHLGRGVPDQCQPLGYLEALQWIPLISTCSRFAYALRTLPKLPERPRQRLPQT